MRLSDVTFEEYALGTVWALLWQPVDGLWATVEVQGQPLDRAVRIAESIRFDVAKKCALPFTVGQAPAGTKLLTCTVRPKTRPRGEAPVRRRRPGRRGRASARRR